MTVHLRNVMQCPHCGFKTTVKMPTQEQQMQYSCEACGVTTQVAAEQCCVFCVWGRYSCPRQQQKIIIDEENKLGK